MQDTEWENVFATLWTRKGQYPQDSIFKEKEKKCISHLEKVNSPVETTKPFE